MSAPSRIGSLPPDRDALRQLLALSDKAFTSGDMASGEEVYLLVLEDLVRGGALVGTSGIAAAAGFNDRLYSDRKKSNVQASAELGVRNRIHTLAPGPRPGRRDPADRLPHRRQPGPQPGTAAAVTRAAAVHRPVCRALQ